MTYEMEATCDAEDRKERRSLALKADSIDYDSDVSIGSSMGSEEDDQELAMLAKRIKHLMNRRKQRRRHGSASSSSSQRSRTSRATLRMLHQVRIITCYATDVANQATCDMNAE